jgi:CheY-like chemotaxis protein
MPGMSGIDVCKRIREFDQAMPILFAPVRLITAMNRPPLTPGRKVIGNASSTRASNQ